MEIYCIWRGKHNPCLLLVSLLSSTPMRLLLTFVPQIGKNCVGSPLTARATSPACGFPGILRRPEDQMPIFISAACPQPPTHASSLPCIQVKFSPFPSIPFLSSVLHHCLNRLVTFCKSCRQHRELRKRSSSPMSDTRPPRR